MRIPWPYPYWGLALIGLGPNINMHLSRPYQTLLLYVNVRDFNFWQPLQHHPYLKGVNAYTLAYTACFSTFKIKPMKNIYFYQTIIMINNKWFENYRSVPST